MTPVEYCDSVRKELKKKGYHISLFSGDFKSQLSKILSNCLKTKCSVNVCADLIIDRYNDKSWWKEVWK